MSAHDCDTCHWGDWHEGILGAPHLGQAPEPGYFTCSIDGSLQAMDNEVGLEDRNCWMPKLEKVNE